MGVSEASRLLGAGVRVDRIGPGTSYHKTLLPTAGYSTPVCAPATAERQRVARSWQTIVGLPLFAYGAAVNFLPYYLPGWLARRMSRRHTDYATIRLLASVAAFPLFWSLETSLVGWAGGLRWALAFFLSLPLGGLIAYRYLVGTGRLRHQLRFGALLLTRAQEARRLLAERREIVEELERAKRDYLGRRERTERLK